MQTMPAFPRRLALRRLKGELWAEALLGEYKKSPPFTSPLMEQSTTLTAQRYALYLTFYRYLPRWC